MVESTKSCALTIIGMVLAFRFNGICPLDEPYGTVAVFTFTVALGSLAVGVTTILAVLPETFTV